jgi:hypothetical protein
MFTKSKGKDGLCTVCRVITAILGVLGVLATLAAVAGVYKAHFLTSGAAFGTSNGSLSIIALVVSMMFTKKVIAMCPCNIGSGK